MQSLIDPRDVTLRNFSRPVNAVALSPEYKNDRSYISGGLAGSLILTTGGRQGVKENANTNSAAAAASGWLGSIGLSGGNQGKDTVLHSGEGTISAVKWSLSGRFVAWVNEQGIKVMRSNLRLEGVDAEYAWKRIAHVDRPKRKGWEEMAGVWRGRMEWIDEGELEGDEEEDFSAAAGVGGVKHVGTNGMAGTTAASESLKHTKGMGTSKRRKIEKLVVGWGDSAWVLHVSPEGPAKGKVKDAVEGQRVGGSATIVHHLLFDDCIVSGLSLYTPSLLLILAYRTRDDSNNPLSQTPEKASPRRGVHHRQNGLSPELRLVNVNTKEEADVDTLTMKNFESLSAADYHLGTLYVPATPMVGPLSQKGWSSVFTDGIWDVGSTLGSGAMSLGSGLGATTRIFSSGMSIRSSGSGGETSNSNTISSPPPSIQAKLADRGGRKPDVHIHSNAATPGLKIFIHSPYDCVLAVKRDLTDHLSWLLEHQEYREAWELVDDHPEVVSAPNFESAPSIDSGGSSHAGNSSVASTPSKHARESLVDFFADDAASQTTISASGMGIVEREKRRIGELWMQQLISSPQRDFSQAGQIAPKVLGVSNRWQHWIFVFAKAGRFDEISPYVPPNPLKPPIEGTAYEVVLGHYINRDRMRLRQLLESWDSALYSEGVVSSAIEERLERGDLKEEEDDWRILMEALGKLYTQSGRVKDALRVYVKLQNADAAMGLVREFHLLPSISDDLRGFVLLRISREQLHTATLQELEELSAEAIGLLVDEAYQGTVAPGMVVNQLSPGESEEPTLQPFLFFYLRALWRGQGSLSVEAARAAELDEDIPSRKKRERQQRQQRLEAEGRALVDDFADLAVELFAEYERAPLLGEFLRASRAYSFEKAVRVCEGRKYWTELVYILSQTGQTKRALNLIINSLGDVSMAISFAKEQDDGELWDDLLEYSMDKPVFIRGLLEEVGTAIDPVRLVRRIPEGLEVRGLREGVMRMVREFEIQRSISEGVAKVLQGEVNAGMTQLRKGRARGVRFEVVRHGMKEKEKEEGVELKVETLNPPEEENINAAIPLNESIHPPVDTNKQIDHDHADHSDDAPIPPGHCAGCRRLFSQEEKETIIGFACGHVFHLSCLLERIKERQPEMGDAVERLQNSLRRDGREQDEGYGGTRSVGSKVAHAHIIRQVVREGCVRCGKSDEEEEG